MVFKFYKLATLTNCHSWQRSSLLFWLTQTCQDLSLVQSRVLGCEQLGREPARAIPVNRGHIRISVSGNAVGLCHFAALPTGL